MQRTLIQDCIRAFVLVLAVALGGASPLFSSTRAQESLGIGKKSKRNKSEIYQPEKEVMAWERYLVKDAPEPTFRFAAGHQHAATGCFGYLYITREEIRYEVKFPEKDSNHGFRYPTSLMEARQWRFMGSSMPEAEFEFPHHKTYHFFRFREGLIEEQASLGSTKLKWEDVRSWEPLVEAATHFDETLRLANQSLAAEKVKIPPTATLRAEPASVEKGHSVTLTWATENALSVDLQPGFGTVAASGSTSATPSDTTTYVLTASSQGGTKVATAQVTATQAVLPPTIILLEPSAESSGQTLEVHSPSLSIRGIAMDASGLPIVTINGTPANLKPKDAHATEFWSDAFPLQPGSNRFEIVAVNAAHAQAKFSFTARRVEPTPAPNPKALSKSDILDLLKNFVSSSRLTEIVKQYGVKFTPTSDDLTDIRQAGGGDDLIDAIKQASAKP